MKIKLTAYAKLQIRLIFLYYKYSVSVSVAQKTKKNIIAGIKHLEKFPESGQREEYMKRYGDNYRRIIAGNYKIIYLIKEKEIIVTDVFDSRQNPAKIEPLT